MSTCSDDRPINCLCANSISREDFLLKKECRMNKRIFFSMSLLWPASLLPSCILSGEPRRTSMVWQPTYLTASLLCSPKESINKYKILLHIQAQPTFYTSMGKNAQRARAISSYREMEALPSLPRRHPRSIGEGSRSPPPHPPSSSLLHPRRRQGARPGEARSSPLAAGLLRRPRVGLARVRCRGGARRSLPGVAVPQSRPAMVA